MKNFYKQEIEKVAMEKIATRAWKKHFVGLSDKNYNRLLQSGVYNPEKELQGISRGTHAMMMKNSAKMVRKPNKAIGARIEMAKDYAETVGRKISDRQIKSLKANASNAPAFSANRVILPTTEGINKPLKSVKGNKTGIVYVPKNEYNKSIYDVKNKDPEYAKQREKQFGIKPISRRDRENRKWTQAITERHEADELRYANKLAKKGKLGEGKDFNPYFSHSTPKVLAQESTHVAMMPRDIKNNQYKAMRNIVYDDGPAGVKSEAESIRDLTGIPYGGSAVYDKAKANKAEKQWFNTGKY